MESAVLFIATITCFGEQPPIVPTAEELQRPFGSADLQAFKNPPKVYRPETWFHFIGGNVSIRGISEDLEAIAEAGIGGIQLFHGQFGGPWPGVEPQIPCLSDSWDAAVAHTAKECKRLGLRFTMQNCPGWAMSGGPWIEPANAMRHLVWSRLDTEQNEAESNAAVNVDLPKPQPSAEDWRDYVEIAVLAFPTPSGDTGQALRPESIKSNHPDLPWEKCFEGNAGGALRLPPGSEENPNWVEVTFPQDVLLRTVELSSVESFLHAFCYEPGVTISVAALSPDGESRPFMKVDLPQSSWQDDRPLSLACDETVSRTFRITIVNRHGMALNSLRLFSAARKNNWESEAGWTLRDIVRNGERPKQSAEAFVELDKITDVSDKMSSEGQLSWKMPPGKWTILRIGHVNAGMRNGPAPPEGTGWECNKLSESGPNAHFAGYIGRLTAPDGPLSGGMLQGVLLDSWECKTQTWTPDMEEEFRVKTGYSLRAWLPAVFGYVIADHETSKRFLHDWRETIGDLFANKFYGRMATLAKENGLGIQYETAAGDIFPADILEYYKHADVPMCEFWQPLSEGYVGSLNFKPIKPTTSAARMYGKPRVAAEAFTSFALTWDEHWEMLKEVFNVNAIEGVTHCVFHTYTHNPRTDFLPPSTSFGAGIGTPFLRGQTWWKQMPAWTDYLSRCGFLLERGKSVSDVLWYLGDEINHKPDQNVPFPNGYKYDYCNPDVLLNRLSVQEGDLMTPEGIRYSVLWMPNVLRMKPETIEKLYELVQQGATVIGNAPDGLATLSGGKEAQKRFDRAKHDLWGNEKTTGLRKVGKGKIVSDMSIDAAIKLLKIAPDVLVDTDPKDNAEVLWLHRQANGADWYFVCAPQGQGFKGKVRFRSLGKICEIWNPMTGNAEPVAFDNDGTFSEVQLDLPVAGSCFVVFHQKAGVLPGQAIKSYRQTAESPLTASWELKFPAGWGTPESLQVEQLKAWKDLDMSAEAKAFSGTVQYATTFRLDDISPDRRYRLDLGSVEMIAVVTVNGKKFPAIWVSPYCVDITEAIQEGENTLTVDVTGTWFNRLVFDAGLPETERKTWTINGPSEKSELRKSGLLGPVILKTDQLETLP